MPPRDEQGFEERRQRIIDGALQVFAEKGFEQATNKAIASASGVGSPGLIYHYFKDKSDLLRQVIEERVPLLHLVAHPEEMMEMPTEQALTHFGRTYLRMAENRQAVAVMKLIIGEAIRHRTFAQIFVEVGPNRVLRFLATYLERQMDAGVLRRTDPNLAARSFMSPLITFVLTRGVFEQPEAVAMDPEVVLTTTVENFLRGLNAD